MKKMPRKPRTKSLSGKPHDAVDKRGNVGVGVAGVGRSKTSPFYPRKKRA